MNSRPRTGSPAGGSSDQKVLLAEVFAPENVTAALVQSLHQRSKESRPRRGIDYFSEVGHGAIIRRMFLDFYYRMNDRKCGRLSEDYACHLEALFCCLKG